MGGSEVHLLLGIKNTNLDPVWIKTLPSCVAVYQSIFKDIWGSDFILAGPHKTFTNGNKMSNINQVIFGIHSVISESESEDESLTDKREYAIIVDSELGRTVNPFSLNPDDLLDVGGQVIPDFEDLVDSCNHVLEECEKNFPNISVGFIKQSSRLLG